MSQKQRPAKSPKNTLRILNSKEVKLISNHFEECFGVPLPVGVYLLNNKNKLYMVNRDIERIDLEVLKIDRLGLYIATNHNEQWRPSLEGSQLIGPNATKGIVDISQDQLSQWLSGEDLEVNDDQLVEGTETKNFVLVRCIVQSPDWVDFIGAGKVKEGKLSNHVPKARRLKTPDHHKNIE